MISSRLPGSTCNSKKSNITTLLPHRKVAKTLETIKAIRPQGGCKNFKADIFYLQFVDTFSSVLNSDGNYVELSLFATLKFSH